MTTLLVSTAASPEDIPAGTLIHEHQSFTFAYTTTAVEQTISLRMPLRQTPYVGGAMPQIFTMNFPEGWLRQKIESRLVREGLVDDMALLRGTGQHQIGRLRLAAKGDMVPTLDSGVLLRDLLTSQRSPELFNTLVEAYFAAGVSGVQPKVLIPDFGSHSKGTFVQPGLIVKAAGEGYLDNARNEFLCMEAARLSDIHVPAFWLSDDEGLFITKRFDRGEDGKVLGFEDMAVLLNAGYDRIGHYKYQGGYEDIAKLIAKVSADPAADRQHFFEYVALSVLTRNGDAHLKNFGMLYESPARLESIRLAPLYDVVTTMLSHQKAPSGVRFITSDRTMALTLRGSKAFPGRDQLISFGRDDCGINYPEQVLDRLANGLESALANHAGRFSADFIGHIHKAWQQGLNSLAQGQVLVSQQRPTLAEYRARQLAKAQNNHAYLLSAFWASNPQLDLVREAFGLPFGEADEADRNALESVWDATHPAHESLMAIVNGDPIARDQATKLGRSRKTLVYRLGRQQPSDLSAEADPGLSAS